MCSRFTRLACCFVVFAAAAASGWHAGRAGYYRQFGNEDSGQAQVKRTAPGAAREFKAGSRHAVWMARVRSAESAEFPGLFAELQEIFPEFPDEDHNADERHEAAVRFLAGHWLEQSPEAVLAFAEQSDDAGGLWSIAGELLGRAWPEMATDLIARKGTQDLPRPSGFRVLRAAHRGWFPPRRWSGAATPNGLGTS